MIIDTHMHIYDDRYNDFRDEIVKKSLELGVGKMIASGVNYDTSLKCLELSKKYESVYATVGLYPEEVKDYQGDLDWIKELVQSNKKIVGIGEIGLDYYWDDSFKDKQKEYFIKQIRIANELGLPIVVHSRNAIQDTFDILKENPTRGVIHCYGGSLEMAREFIKLGYFLGIGGVVTFKNAKEIKRVVKEIDINYLLSETDSPYLTPHPYRGETNIPGYTKYVIEEIAKIKEMDVNEVEKILENNAKRLFNI